MKTFDVATRSRKVSTSHSRKCEGVYSASSDSCPTTCSKCRAGGIRREVTTVQIPLLRILFSFLSAPFAISVTNLGRGVYWVGFLTTNCNRTELPRVQQKLSKSL